MSEKSNKGEERREREREREREGGTSTKLFVCPETRASKRASHVDVDTMFCYVYILLYREKEPGRERLHA